MMHSPEDSDSSRTLRSAMSGIISGSPVHVAGEESVLDFGFADLGNILSNPLTRSLQVRVAVKGRKVQEDKYTRRTFIGRQSVEDSICPDRVARLLAQGATVTLDSLELSSPKVAMVCRMVERELKRQCTATAYVTLASTDGLAPHTDEEDVMMVQTAGAKYWRYAPPPEGRPVRSGLVGGSCLDGVERTLLDAGGIIALPAGSPHAGTASSQGSIHVTFSVERPRYRTLLGAILTSGEGADGLGTLDEQIPFDPADIDLMRHLEPLRSLLTDPARALAHDHGLPGARDAGDDVLSRYRSWDLAADGVATIRAEAPFELETVDERRVRLVSETCDLRVVIGSEDAEKIRSVRDHHEGVRVDIALMPIIPVLIGYGLLSASEQGK